MTAENFLTVKEFSDKFGKDRFNVLRMIHDGRIPAQKMGSQWIIPADAVPPPDGRVKSGKYLGARKKGDRCCYPAVLTQEPGQEIAVVFPDLDAATSGQTEEDALKSARELLACVLSGLQADGQPFPQPSSLDSLTLTGNQKSVLVDAPSIRR